MVQYVEGKQLILVRTEEERLPKQKPVTEAEWKKAAGAGRADSGTLHADIQNKWESVEPQSNLLSIDQVKLYKTINLTQLRSIIVESISAMLSLPCAKFTSS